jgi:hypothetical protein
MSALTRIVATVIGLFSATASQAQQGTTPTPCPASGARVFLAADGSVSLNGKPIPAAELKAALSALNPRPSEICYSRGNSNGAPPSNVERVMDDIASLRVPISFYTDATFSRRVVLR